MDIYEIIDTGSKERYIVFYKGKYTICYLDEINEKLRFCVFMTEIPVFPYGYYQHGYADPKSIEGKRIKAEELPPVCRKVVDLID